MFVLTKRQADLIDALVKSGRFQNASEVLRYGCGWWINARLRTPANCNLWGSRRGSAEALERGDFEEFGSIEDLQAHLNDLSETMISGAMLRKIPT
jgi:antitoxin ParD1/3/4